MPILDDHAVCDAARCIVPNSSAVLRVVEIDSRAGLAHADSGELARVDKFALHALAIFQLQPRAVGDSVHLLLQLVGAAAVAVETRAHCKSVHGFLRPAHNRFDGKQLRRDADSKILQRVLAVVVSLTEPIFTQLAVPHFKQLNQHVGIVSRRVGR